ncbi:Uncharacterized protein Adt_33020 [Abeliophyllum distichum]|uniref:Uncharacterized protein n=1 Tax=Abeliophyllum distichum TaxID=126358 RepID=A0ABD1QYP2_9LAMI
MDVDHKPIAIQELLFNFTGDSLVLRGKITLAVDFGELPCHLKKFMEFLVVDTRSAYHRVLSRLVLKDLQVVASIYYLTMKFLTPEPMDIYLEKTEEDRVLDEGLDPKIICSDLLALPAEELEAFPVNPSDNFQMLQLGQKLEEGMKKEMK